MQREGGGGGGRQPGQAERPDHLQGAGQGRRSIPRTLHQETQSGAQQG